jgi:hypothetical protein
MQPPPQQAVRENIGKIQFYVASKNPNQPYEAEQAQLRWGLGQVLVNSQKIPKNS